MQKGWFNPTCIPESEKSILLIINPWYNTIINGHRCPEIQWVVVRKFRKVTIKL